MARRKKYPDFPYTEIQKKWLKVLEGHDRKFKPDQGMGRLRSEDKFCCLGVAAHILIEAKIIAAEWCAIEGPLPNTARMHLIIDDNKSDPQETILDERSTELMGLRDVAGNANQIQWEHNGRFANRAFMPEALYELNDQGYSFAQIAKALRMFPHCYFNNGGNPTGEIYLDKYRNDWYIIDDDIGEPDTGGVS